MSFADELKYDTNGLVTVVIQDAETNEVLTLAYMNREAVQKTLETGKTWFWRRSHQKLMMKGETSGNVQIVKEILVDCDKDALVVKIEQIGRAACHEGYVSCFFRKVNTDGSVEIVGERMFDPAEVYGERKGSGLRVKGEKLTATLNPEP